MMLQINWCYQFRHNWHWDNCFQQFSEAMTQTFIQLIKRVIRYTPSKVRIELKSLKFSFVQSFFLNLRVLVTYFTEHGGHIDVGLCKI